MIILYLIPKVYYKCTTESNRENEILGHLEGKYNKSFVIKSKAKQSDISKENEVADDDFVYGYNVYCKLNKDIVFTSGIIKRVHVCPLLFPKKRNEHFDDFEQKAKEYNEKKYQNENFELYSIEDVDKLEKDILHIMELNKKELEKYGIIPTNRNCATELNIKTRNGCEKIDFYTYDKDVVHELLYKLYLRNR